MNKFELNIYPYTASQVVFLHPVHNFALVAYDPSALGAGASVVRAAKLLPGLFLDGHFVFQV